MRKIVFAAVFLFTMIFLSGTLLAKEDIVSIRNSIYDESSQIKSTLYNTNNLLLVNNMWNTCIMTVKQIDAYFFMLRLLNSIDKEHVKEDSVDTIIKWLENMKKGSESSIKGLNELMSQSKSIDTVSKKHMGKLDKYYKSLVSILNSEITNYNKLKVDIRMR